MWEIFSAGNLPYRLATNAEVTAMVQQGYRLEQPESCPNRVYFLMFSCWRDARPTFDKLHGVITEIVDMHFTNETFLMGESHLGQPSLANKTDLYAAQDTTSHLLFDLTEMTTNTTRSPRGSLPIKSDRSSVEPVSALNVTLQTYNPPVLEDFNFTDDIFNERLNHDTNDFETMSNPSSFQITNDSVTDQASRAPKSPQARRQVANNVSFSDVDKSKVVSTRTSVGSSPLHVRTSYSGTQSRKGSSGLSSNSPEIEATFPVAISPYAKLQNSHSSRDSSPAGDRKRVPSVKLGSNMSSSSASPQVPNLSSTPTVAEIEYSSALSDPTRTNSVRRGRSSNNFQSNALPLPMIAAPNVITVNTGQGLVSGYSKLVATPSSGLSEHSS